MRTIVFILTLVLLNSSCNDEDKKEVEVSENYVDAARNFIRASLDRKWDEARKYMLQDSANVERMNIIEDSYSDENREERRGYREASITTYDSRLISDSVSIVQYSNSYKNKRDSLKVVRVNGQWLVDLKYSILPIDSTRYVQ